MPECKLRDLKTEYKPYIIFVYLDYYTFLIQKLPATCAQAHSPGINGSIAITCYLHVPTCKTYR